MEIRQKNKTSLDFCLLVFLITSSRRGGQFSWVTWTELEKKYKICIFYIFCCSAGVIWSSLSEEYVHNKNQQTYLCLWCFVAHLKNKWWWAAWRCSLKISILFLVWFACLSDYVSLTRVVTHITTNSKSKEKIIQANCVHFQSKFRELFWLLELDSWLYTNRRDVFCWCPLC